MNENLPIGWVQSPLIDLLSDLITGKRPKGGVKDITEGVLSLGGEHISSDGRLKLEKPRYIPHEFAQSIKHALIRVNDILIVKDGATTGKTAFIFEHQLKEVAYINEHLFICRSCKEIHPLYLFYFLRSEIGNKAILADFRGATQGGISREFAHKVIVPCAPLNEQRRIVEKLDRIFDRLRRVRDELSHIKKLIDRYRQSVLTAAFRGDLTADWRLSSSISLVSLSEICNSITDGDHQPPPKSETGIPFITISAINDGSLKLNKATRFVSKSYFESLPKIRKPEINDILFTVTGSIGIPVIVNINEPFVFQRHIAILKPNRDIILPKYLLYALGSEQVKKQSINVATGTAQLTIPLSGLRNFQIQLPPLEEQKEIVRRIEERFAKIEKIEQEYQKAVKLCDRLEQATLAKAFRGELVPQDPNDEPASVLLERIRSEKKTLTQPKGKGRRQK